MWYAVETVFIDGKFFDSMCCFADGDNVRGVCHSQELYPHNSVERKFNDRIEIHLDWFEDKETAKKFQEGMVTYVHTYDTYYKKSINSTFSRQSGRKIVAVDIKNGMLPHKEVIVENKLTAQPYWAR